MESMYDREAVRPMWEELAQVGVEPLVTPELVDVVFENKQGTLLVVINSVCGCAAGGARPGVSLALQHHVIPDRYVTVFAGVDRGAVERVRHYMAPLPPSSPCIGLFKDGELVHALPRHQIETMDARMIALDLQTAFDKFCSKKGPSVPEEVFNAQLSVQQCGSSIPLNRPLM